MTGIPNYQLKGDTSYQFKCALSLLILFPFSKTCYYNVYVI